MNLDFGLYSKMNANHLNPYLPNIIHLDQTSFTMGHEARDNVPKTVSLIQAAQRPDIPVCLPVVDAEKTLDRVDWCFIEESLQQIGLSEPIPQNKGPLRCHNCQN